MTGRKIPYTKSRAIAHMMCNEVYKKERRHLKRQARREDRHYLVRVDKINNSVYDVLFSAVDEVQAEHPYLGYKFNEDMSYGLVWVRNLVPNCAASFLIPIDGSVKYLIAATNAVVDAYSRRQMDA